MSKSTGAIRVAVLMACFNRKELTLRALNSLRLSDSPFVLTVFLFNDGSIDGTREAVVADFPEVVIIEGNGTAFWNGGMHRAWSEALKHEFDGYLWLNDDVILDGDALERLHQSWIELGGDTNPLLLVGPVRASDGTLSYGGINRNFSPFALRFQTLPIQGTLQRSETFHGNIVLVSARTVERIGINDPGFLHTLGDIDYGLRATKAGIPNYVMPKTLGICEVNEIRRFERLPFRQRLKRINTPFGLPFRNWFRMTARWSGVWMPLHFLLPYRKLISGS